ncbi:MAG: ATPase, T2SS/T4P/T4SS family [Candidatus Korarchaeum sp.]
MKLALSDLYEGQGRVFKGVRTQEGVKDVIVMVSSRDSFLKDLISAGKEVAKRGLFPSEAYVSIDGVIYKVANPLSPFLVEKNTEKIVKIIESSLTDDFKVKFENICPFCEFNPANLRKNSNKISFILREILPLIKVMKDGSLESLTKREDAPTECVKCVYKTMSKIKNLRVFPEPIEITPVGNAGESTRVEAVRDADPISKLKIGPWNISILETYEIIGGEKVYRLPMVAVEPLTKEELLIFNKMKSRLIPIVRKDNELRNLYLYNRSAFRERLFSEIVKASEGIKGVDIEKISGMLADVIAIADWVTPLLRAWRELGITDIFMSGNNYVTLKVAEPIGIREPSTTLKTNIYLSKETVSSIIARLADCSPSIVTHKGVTETTVDLNLGRRVIVRLAAHQSPQDVSANLRIMIPTGFYHFLYKYKNLDADVLSILSFLFPRLSTVFVGEVGTVKSTLMQILLNALPRGSIVNYISEGFEFIENVKELTINRFRIETPMETSESRKTRRDVIREVLRHRSNLVIFEEARTAEEMAELCEHALITHVVTTTHADSHEKFVERFLNKAGLTPERLAAFKLIVNMQKWIIGNSERYVVSGIYKYDGSKFEEIARAIRTDKGIEWVTRPPEDIISIFREELVIKGGTNVQELNRFIEMVKGYANLLQKYKGEIEGAYPFDIDFRGMDREAMLLIWGNLRKDVDTSSVLRMIDEIIRKHIGSTGLLEGS